MTNGPKVSAYGRGSRFGWLHSALDLPEAFENLTPEVHGDAVSFEFIAEVNPDWLIVVDRSVAIGEKSSAQTTLDNPLVAGTTAAENDQIIYLSAAPLYIAGGGYTSLLTTLGEMTAAFIK
jgi:iron complex transport system substrate-binding protein